MSYIRQLFLAMSLGILLILTGGCSSTATSESTGQYVDNAAITTKVKAKLLNKLGSDGLSIRVKSYKDEVQLSGFVNDQEIKDSAARIALSVDGAKQVKNDIIVKR